MGSYKNQTDEITHKNTAMIQLQKSLKQSEELNSRQQSQINELLTKCKKLKKLELENEKLKKDNTLKNTFKNFENLHLSDKNSDSGSSHGDSGVAEEYEAEIVNLKTKLSRMKEKLISVRSENSELQENLAKAR